MYGVVYVDQLKRLIADSLTVILRNGGLLLEIRPVLTIFEAPLKSEPNAMQGGFAVVPVRNSRAVVQQQTDHAFINWSESNSQGHVLFNLIGNVPPARLVSLAEQVVVGAP